MRPASNALEDFVFGFGDSNAVVDAVWTGAEGCLSIHRHRYDPFEHRLAKAVVLELLGGRRTEHPFGPGNFDCFLAVELGFGAIEGNAGRAAGNGAMRRG